MPELDLSESRRVHIVGVGGAGMSAIATVLARGGHVVSGSDLKESRNTERLRALGVDARVGHDPANLPPQVDAVVRSTAVGDDNVEVAAAIERGIPVLARSEALRAIVRTRRSIAVAGSHGKTTTASMLAIVLREAGLRPSFLIGGDVNEVGANAAVDDGEWLVVEADESDGTFLELDPEVAVVTNVEPDHLEHYGGFDALVDAFERFLRAVEGPRVVGVDDNVTATLAQRIDGLVTYGTDGGRYRIEGYRGSRLGCTFEFHRDGKNLGSITLPVPGLHNARNAAAAATTALELGVDFSAVTSALARFGGVARRFQPRGERDGVTFIDDYAHLPTEVASTIRAAREGAWRRVVAVFQPHRYSRTEALWRDFAEAFADADVVILTDVYSAGERPRPGVSGRLVLRAVLDARPSTDVTYLPRHSDLAAQVPRIARPGDLVLTLGAGDLTSLPDEWLAQ